MFQQKLSDMAMEVRLPLEKFTWLVPGDVHFDNPKCQRKVFFKMLDEARARNAKIFFPGDFFCAMQGRGDPRHTKDGLRPEYTVARYLDQIVDDATEKLLPYADLILGFGTGNHESKIVKFQETDILARLVQQLNDKAGTNIIHLGYHGYIMFKHGTPPNKNVKKWNHVQTVTAYYHHGNWGGIISKGMQAVPRYASFVPDADLIVTGHTHDRWATDHGRYHLDKVSGRVVERPQVHIKAGTLKQEFTVPNGWAIEKITMPKAIGGFWIKHNPYQERMKKDKKHYSTKMIISYENTV